MSSEELVNPNLHVVLIHYPIALLFVGVLIEMFSIFWARSGFRAAGRWMILIGALSTIPTSLSGLYALSDVLRMSNPSPDASWSAMVASSPLAQEDEVWQMLQSHAWLNFGATVLFSAVAVIGLAARDLSRTALRLPLLAVLVIGLAIIAGSAWYGGEMVYRHGVGVHSFEARLAEQTTTQIAELERQLPGPGGPATTPAAEEQTETKAGFEHVFPPLQMHVIFAGVTIALAMAAMGLSFRAVNRVRPASPVEEFPELSGHTNEPPIAMTDAPAAARHPVTRFWVLATLVGVLTASWGWWVLLRDQPQPWRFGEIWSDTIAELPRRIWHVLTAGGIIILPLVLGAIARFSPQRRLLLLILSLLLLIAVALQIWLGTLLMWDTPAGSVWGFN